MPVPYKIVFTCPVTQEEVIASAYDVYRQYDDVPAVDCPRCERIHELDDQS